MLKQQFYANYGGVGNAGTSQMTGSGGVATAALSTQSLAPQDPMQIAMQNLLARVFGIDTATLNPTAAFQSTAAPVVPTIPASLATDFANLYLDNTDNNGNVDNDGITQDGELDVRLAQFVIGQNYAAEAALGRGRDDVTPEELAAETARLSLPTAQRSAGDNFALVFATFKNGNDGQIGGDGDGVNGNYDNNQAPAIFETKAQQLEDEGNQAGADRLREIAERENFGTTDVQTAAGVADALDEGLITFDDIFDENGEDINGNNFVQDADAYRVAIDYVTKDDNQYGMSAYDLDVLKVANGQTPGGNPLREAGSSLEEIVNGTVDPSLLLGSSPLTTAGLGADAALPQAQTGSLFDDLWEQVLSAFMGLSSSGGNVSQATLPAFGAASAAVTQDPTFQTFGNPMAGRMFAQSIR